MSDTEYYYSDLEAKWRAESCLPEFVLPDDVYADQSLLSEFSDRWFDWKHYVEPVRFAEARLHVLRGGYLKLISEWLREPLSVESGLVIIGENGAGKTFSALAAARFLTLHGILKRSDLLYRPRCLMLECVDAHNLLDGWNKKQDAANEVDKFKTVDLLILDDLGAVSTSAQAAVANIVSIVAARYNANLPTIVTTNMDSNELINLYGSTTVRRLINDDVSVVVV